MNKSVARIKHVVVLMMENRSYDHLLGGYEASLTNKPLVGVNVYGQTSYRQQPFSPNATMDLMVTPNLGFGPMHEFDNVQTQLGQVDPATKRFDLSGFVADAAKTFADLHAPANATPEAWIGRVMEYLPYDGPDRLPATQKLARSFAVSNRWFSSVPGPTWPNRFFALMGSCHGRVLMPNHWNDADDALKTFLRERCQASIFTLMNDAGVTNKVYADSETPLAYMINGAGFRNTISAFEHDVRDGTLPAFSWIEPNYGMLGCPGNSQHPPEDLRFGDAFIARVFNAITAVPKVWEQTLFVLLYDEHGGFYDSEPPRITVAPDSYTADVTVNGKPFGFDLTGLRVPAIFASPLIKPGVFTPPDDAFYDHTSLLAFLCDRFKLERKALGERVAQASHFGDNDQIWADAPRAEVLCGFALTPPDVPVRPPLFRAYESELATEYRQLIQATHAYLTGGSPAAAMRTVPTRELTRYPRLNAHTVPDLPAFPTAAQLGSMAERSIRLLQAASQVPPGGGGTRTRAGATIKAAITAAPPADGPFRVLCIHGVGHGDGQHGWRVDPDWKSEWESEQRTNLAAAGLHRETEFSYLAYDDAFGSGPTFEQIARGLGLLAESLLFDTRRDTREFSPHEAGQALRWTAGMAIQWIEDHDLRDHLCEMLLAVLGSEKQPHLIVAHSLGSLIAYDACRVAITHHQTDIAPRLRDTILLTFGSQIGHPVVIREAWGGVLRPLHDDNPNGNGLAHWFHLYNPNDRVFTCPLEPCDAARTDYVTEFTSGPLNGMLSLNHSAELYLRVSRTAPGLWEGIRQQGEQGAQLSAALRVRQRTRVLSRSTRRALLVGINQYPDPVNRLHGCLNDVYLISEMLQESGLAADDIHVLADSRATRANIMARLQWLVEGAAPGDERMFYYSGHGTQIPEYGPGGFVDHISESLVPFDFNWDDPATYFTDKEFRRFYTNLPFGRHHGALQSHAQPDTRLTVIFDCCHAAGMTRGTAARALAMPGDIRHRMLRWNALAKCWQHRDFVGEPGMQRAFDSERAPRAVVRGWRAQGTAYGQRPFDPAQIARLGSRLGHQGPYMPLLMYAAGQSELATERIVGQLSYGAFTHALVAVVRDAAPDKGRTFRTLMNAVRTELSRTSSGQRPELVGPRDAQHASCPWR